MKHVLLQGTALLCAVFLPGCVRSSALVHQAGLGPRIEIVQPKGDLVENSPFAIQIEFVPQTGSQIDVNSFDFALLIGPLRMTLRDRLRRYVTKKGFYIPDARLTRGTYNFEVSIRDTSTTRSILFKDTLTACLFERLDLWTGILLVNFRDASVAN